MSVGEQEGGELQSRNQTRHLREKALLWSGRENALQVCSLFRNARDLFSFCRVFQLRSGFVSHDSHFPTAIYIRSKYSLIGIQVLRRSSTLSFHDKRATRSTRLRRR